MIAQVKSLHKVNVCRQKKNTVLQGQLEMVEGFFFCCALQVTTDTWEIFHIHSHHFELVHFYTLFVILLFDDLESRIFLLIQRKMVYNYTLSN
jgi:hypothetical protein